MSSREDWLDWMTSSVRVLWEKIRAKQVVMTGTMAMRENMSRYWMNKDDFDFIINSQPLFL